MTNNKYSKILSNFVLKQSTLCTHQEFRLTVYLLSVLNRINEDDYIVYMNELIEGTDWIIDKRLELYNPVSLSETEILNFIDSINQRGILQIETYKGSNYSFHISLGKRNSYEQNQKH